MMIAKERITTERRYFIKSIDLEELNPDFKFDGVELGRYEGESVYQAIDRRNPLNLVACPKIDVEYCRFKEFRQYEEHKDHIKEEVTYIAMPEKVANVLNNPFKTIDNQQKQIDYLRKDCNKFLDLSNSLINHVNGLAELSFWDRVLMVFKGVPRYSDAVGNKCDE